MIKVVFGSPLAAEIHEAAALHLQQSREFAAKVSATRPAFEGLQDLHALLERADASVAGASSPSDKLAAVTQAFAKMPLKNIAKFLNAHGQMVDSFDPCHFDKSFEEKCTRLTASSARSVYMTVKILAAGFVAAIRASACDWSGSSSTPKFREEVTEALATLSGFKQVAIDAMAELEENNPLLRGIDLQKFNAFRAVINDSISIREQHLSNINGIKSVARTLASQFERVLSMYMKDETSSWMFESSTASVNAAAEASESHIQSWSAIPIMNKTDKQYIVDFLTNNERVRASAVSHSKLPVMKQFFEEVSHNLVDDSKHGFFPFSTDWTVTDTADADLW